MTGHSYIFALDWDENGNIQANSFAKPTYYYNDKWQVLCDYNDSNDLQMWFTYGNYIDEVLTANEGFAGSGYRYYVHDHLYSSVALVYYNGSVLERYEYDAYGNCYILEPNFADDPDGKSDYGNPYLFTGRRVDILDNDSLKIQYNRNRYYDQYTGRWLTHDPMGYVDSMNLYEYASSNPVITIDPSGLSVIGGVVIIRGVVEGLFRYCTGWFNGPHLWRQVKRAAARLADARCLPGAFTGGGNPYKHCVWSCKVAKKHGEKQAEKCARLKEDLDWAIADLADSIRSSCWDRMGDRARKAIAAWVCSAFQLSDFRDNAAGRLCGTDECLKCEYAECKDCCSGYHGITPRTPEGKKSKGERPYSKRCTDRYKKALGELK